MPLQQNASVIPLDRPARTAALWRVAMPSILWTSAERGTQALARVYIQLQLSRVTFERDPAKSEQNLRERGFDFAFAAVLFSGQYVEFDDTRRDYGERRIVALGRADGISLTVVFTDRLTPTGAVVRRVISARLSNRKERRRYAESLEAIRPEADDRA